jgi:Tol biopolymer transport system component
VLDLSPWPDADAILDAALALPAGERRAYVAARVTDPALRAALMRVLDEATAGDGFLHAAAGGGGRLIARWRQTAHPDTPALAPGDAIGVYRIVDSLGRGGMGEVYRALDPSLGREVAIKVLSDDVVGDPMRLARFRREARLLASLNHPHIGAIYTVVEDEPRFALVLELVEGPTLAERLAEGPVPLAQALEIGRQIAEAIAAAHEKSVVHRDLKPANIKLSPSGLVKVLDFGIAKALTTEEGEAAPEPSLTGTGPRAAIGTAAYMSPEQARGEPVDHRADIWAFGCVLYEMLTGERAFPGDSTVETLGRVLERDPDFSRLPPRTPAAVRRLLRRALEKQPRRRLGHIGDALLDLEDGQAALDGGGTGEGFRVTRVALTRWWAPALSALIAAGATWLWTTSRVEPASAPVELALPVPADQEVVVGQLPALAVSRDGRTLVYRARQDGTMRLFVRTLDSRDTAVVPGSEDVAGHALSPDGRSVVFAARGDVFRAALGGGTPVRLAALPGGAALSWGTPDTIVASGGAGGALRRLAASGGEATEFTTVDTASGQVAHGAPELLSDGRTVLLTVSAITGTHLGVTTLESGVVTLLTEGRQPRLLPSGHLVFARGRGLWMAPFDAAARRLTADPVQVFDDVERSALNAFVHFAISETGTLFYVPWRERAGLMHLSWHDRAGVELSRLHEAPGLTRFSLSPDGRRVAVAVADGDDRTVWVIDPERGTTSRLALAAAAGASGGRESGGSRQSQPVWSPDGRLIAYRSDLGDGGVHVGPADGAAPPRPLTRAAEGFHIPYAFTPDGLRILFTDFRDYGDQDIRAVHIETLADEALLVGPYAETHPAISPDGRWLAYQSDESGRFEVYLRPFPDLTRARWQVSVAGGTSAAWRRDGRELLFASGAVLTAVDIDGAGAVPRVGAPRPLFAVASSGERLGPQFEPAPDGQRILVLSPAPSDPVAERPEVRVVQGWAAVAVGRGRW